MWYSFIELDSVFDGCQNRDDVFTRCVDLLEELNLHNHTDIESTLEEGYIVFTTENEQLAEKLNFEPVEDEVEDNDEDCGCADCEESTIRLGYLRQDDDCHWYCVPEDQVEEFDNLLNKCFGKDYDDCYKDYDLFNEKFAHLMLDGGVENVKVIVEQKV